MKFVVQFPHIDGEFAPGPIAVRPWDGEESDETTTPGEIVIDGEDKTQLASLAFMLLIQSEISYKIIMGNLIESKDFFGKFEDQNKKQ